MKSFFGTCRFSLFSAEPLYQNVRIDHRITFTLLQNSENHGKPQVESWFFGFSPIFDFSVYSPNNDGSQGRGSYFSSIVIPLEIRIPGGQPRYLSLST